MIKNNFAYTILYVQDVKQSLEFYKTAFGLETKFITPDNTYGELITEGTTLSFASVGLARTNLKDGFIESNSADKPFGMEIGLTTHNVQEAVDRAIIAGALLVEKPKTKPWGQTVAYVKDIDGFLVEICTPIL